MSAVLPERPPISAPSPARAVAQRAQPALGVAGLSLVLPVALLLGAGWGGPERSLIVLGPISTFALPVVAMVAFWWEDWPGTLLRAPLLGLGDTLLVVAGGVVLTLAGQAVVMHADLRGVFDPAAPPAHAPVFPATMPLAGAIFTALLQLTLVCEGAPLRRLGRIPAGVAALALAWAAGLALYFALVRGRLMGGAELGAVLVCVGAVQVTFYVVLRGWPFAGITSRAARLATANAAVIAGGCVAYVALGLAGLAPATVTAVAGAAVAGGLAIGMLFEGWLGPNASLAAEAALAAVLYLGLHALAQAASWTRAQPADWTGYAALNAIGAGIILHVAIGRRWPFAVPG